jgi:hypothetical protein
LVIPRVVLCVAVLTACGSPTLIPALTQTPLPTANAETTPSPSPTPKPPPTLKELGHLYLEVVNRVNQRVCTLNTLADAAEFDWRMVRRAARDLADALRRWADKLRAIEWTRSVQGDINRLIRAVAAEEVAFRAAVAADEETSFVHLMIATRRPNSRAAAAANAVRSMLGIKSLSGDPCRA